jgi:eukaryotic-like serine/threonine-protein kinase
MSNPETQPGAMELADGMREGAVLSGKYRIGPVLGAGAMGIVVAARHLLLNEDVAIKFLVAGRWDQADAVQRFVREAQAAVRIQSEHVVRVLDVAVTEGGAPYIVMEHLKGMDLAKRLRANGPLPVELAIDLVLQACEAIAESHRIGIVHRDLKPANLFVLERDGAAPRIKVLDFGISKSTRLVPKTVDLDGTLESAQITQAKAVLGSPFYMSPEQMDSAREVDGRTDIWALGVTLFEMITGHPPFTGGSLVQIYAKMTSPDESGWRLALERHPRPLTAIIGKCLEWDRERRYGTVREFASAIAPLGSKGASASLRRIAPSPDPSESNPGVERVPSLTAAPRPGRLLLGRNLVAATLAGFLGSAVFVLGSGPRSAGQPPPPITAPAPEALPAAFPARRIHLPETRPALSSTLPVSTAPLAEPSSPPGPGAANLAAAKAPRPAPRLQPAAASAAGPFISADASTAPSATVEAPASPAASSFIPENLRGLLEKRE